MREVGPENAVEVIADGVGLSLLVSQRETSVLKHRNIALSLAVAGLEVKELRVCIALAQVPDA